MLLSYLRMLLIFFSAQVQKVLSFGDRRYLPWRVHIAVGFPFFFFFVSHSFDMRPFLQVFARRFAHTSISRADISGQTPRCYTIRVFILSRLVCMYIRAENHFVTFYTMGRVHAPSGVSFSPHCFVPAVVEKPLPPHNARADA